MRGFALSFARVYVRRGWPVMPCHGIEHGRCSCHNADCSSPGKHPLLHHGLHEATTVLASVHGWWQRWPNANVGVRTGDHAGRGLVVVDIDPDHGGEASLDRLVAEHGPLPFGPEVVTGSGGRHLYFAHPGVRVPNSAGTRLGAGVDVRGDGGYVIAPPSTHVSGGGYHWSRLGPLPALPEWLMALLVPPPREPRPLTPPAAISPDSGSAWARAALEGELGAVRHAEVGRRNHVLNRSAFVLGQIVGGEYLAEAVVAALLEEAGLAAGLDVREVRATVASGLRAGAAQPRHPRARSDGRSGR